MNRPPTSYRIGHFGPFVNGPYGEGRTLFVGPAHKKAEANASAFLLRSIHDLNRNFLALSLGNGPHKDTDLLDDPALPADDLAHIAVGHADLKYGLAVGFALGHRDLVGMIDQALYEVGQKFFHAGRNAFLCLKLFQQAADGERDKGIGRQGRIVKQIRVLMRAVAQKKGKKVSVEILD